MHARAHTPLRWGSIHLARHGITSDRDLSHLAHSSVSMRTGSIPLIHLAQHEINPPPSSPASTSRSIHRDRPTNRNPSAPGPSPESIRRRRPAEYSCVANSCTSPICTSRKPAAGRPPPPSRSRALAWGEG
jgi:hypothetical protein